MSNSDVGLVEINAAENIQGNKQFAKFRMLHIEKGKHVYYICTLVMLTFRTEVLNISTQMADTMIIYSWSLLGHALDAAGVTLRLV